MPKLKNSPKKPDLVSSELFIIRALLAVALGISVFLAWSSFKGGGIPGCGPESGCDKVLSSRWAYAFGLPISVYAIPVYAALIALMRPAGLRWKVVAPLAFLILASALWFVGLQAFAIRAFCKFCMVAHTCGTVAALMLIRRAPLDARSTGISLGIASAAAAILAVAQIAAPERGPTQIASTIVPAPAANAEVQPAPQAPVITNTFTIVDGQFTLDLAKVPVSGPLDAPRKLAKLFDYTCHHCRDLHHLLTAFRAKHPNELAVISLPLPLDANCNPVMKRTPSAHVNACEYTKLGLAIFQADPSKFEEYTEWIYKPERPPEINAARQYAAELVGSDALNKALQDPAVAEQIRQDVNIYVTASRIAKSGQLPQMYFERGASIGAISSQQQLEQIMFERLGFPLESR